MADRFHVELLEIRDKYRKAGQPWPATAYEIAEWAVSKKLFDIPIAQKAKILRKHLAEAFRKDECLSPSGERIRSMIAFPKMTANGDGKPSQKMFWDDIRTADHANRLAAFRYRYKQGRCDIRKLQKEIHVVNTEFLRKGESPIQFDFDFNKAHDDEG